MSPRRRWLVPEVVQTSAMDCGPAALKALCEGFGLPVSYGRLREACQTDVDGTSIDTLEQVAGELGLVADQLLVPREHLLLQSAQTLPALVVLRAPGGDTHFVVVWRRHGPYVQLMDPARGRRWVANAQLLAELYLHTTSVPAEAYDTWARSDDFVRPFRERLARIGAQAACEALLERRRSAADSQGIAVLEAAVRLVEGLIEGRGLAPGAEAARLLLSLAERAELDDPLLPAALYTARSGASPAQTEVRGAVIVRIGGLQSRSALPAPGAEPARALSPELAAALGEPPTRWARELWRLLRSEGALPLSLLLAALASAALLALLEALVLRALLDLGRDLVLPEQRLVALAAWLALATLALGLEWHSAGALAGLGRRLEARLRVAFLAKLPRLEDRYFQSRPSSDMAERSHSTHALRQLPALGGQIVRNVFELLAVCSGLVWLDPADAALVLGAGGCALLVPLVLQPLLGAQD